MSTDTIFVILQGTDFKIMEKIEKKQLIYERIARNIEAKIRNNVLRLGDKLPSIREACSEHGISKNSVLQAYYVLEGKGLIESRPQSGYYVCYSKRQLASVPETSNPQGLDVAEETEALVNKVLDSQNNQNNIILSLGAPAISLLPIAKLNKAMVHAIRELDAGGTLYEITQGNSNLRRQIARQSFSWEGNLNESDIITTAGCMNALSFCLMSVTESGDTVVVESPVYFGLLQLARSLGLHVLELPTNATTGIELDALKDALQQKQVKACILISNFSNPLGSCMPDEHKREAVRLMEKYNVPLIEDDLYGDIYFGSSRPSCCKTYDESGMVLWCSSASKTLAPGYRVGWTAPGKFKEKVLRTKRYHSLSSNTISQEAIAIFLETGRYENHLRKLRSALQCNSLQFMRSIVEHFPHDTKVSYPQGGFILWIELNKSIDTMELFKIAMSHKISIAPGRLFSLQKQYGNCMRLSYGLIWDERVEGALKLLGSICKGLLK
ncbi:MAG: PLP-dependent aminotransferase family protein [Flavobacterium sp.]|uniref:aminotransferase-like domain-containing protein n=1 Tax=Flavobacterium sp. TaxID=239 RepID=UPI003264E3D2